MSLLEYTMQAEQHACRHLEGHAEDPPQMQEQHITSVQTVCDYASAAEALRSCLDLTLMELYEGHRVQQ